MSTRIDFYLDAPDKIAVAARIVHKAYAAGQQMVIYAPQASAAEAINRQLWTQPPLSFVPHCRADDRLATETPILIAGNAAQLHAVAAQSGAPHQQLLINLDHNTPADFACFARLIEIVSLDEEDRAPARQRFRQYREDGFTIHSHRLGARE